MPDQLLPLEKAQFVFRAPVGIGADMPIAPAMAGAEATGGMAGATPATTAAPTITAALIIIAAPTIMAAAITTEAAVITTGEAEEVTTMGVAATTAAAVIITVEEATTEAAVIIMEEEAATEAAATIAVRHRHARSLLYRSWRRRNDAYDFAVTRVTAHRARSFYGKQGREDTGGNDGFHPGAGRQRRREERFIRLPRWRSAPCFGRSQSPRPRLSKS
jgi:hypothetical protein